MQQSSCPNQSVYDTLIKHWPTSSPFFQRLPNDWVVGTGIGSRCGGSQEYVAHRRGNDLRHSKYSAWELDGDVRARASLAQPFLYYSDSLQKDYHHMLWNYRKSFHHGPIRQDREGAVLILLMLWYSALVLRISPRRNSTTGARYNSSPNTII